MNRADDDQVAVVVHDFAGHPFQVQLARHLASSGLRSTHLYCSSFQTPHGDVGDEDAETGFRSIAVSTRKPFAKYSTGRRLLQELEYGWRAARAIRSLRPDVVISANVPLVAAFVCHVATLLSRIRVIFWQQDVYSVAMATHLRANAGIIGRLVGWVLIRLERWLLRTSKRIVVISADFVETLDEWNLDRDKISVIENWAPLEEMPEGTRPNPWSERHGITDDDVVLLYAGTLGLKHHPSAVLEVARAFADRPDVKVFVASEGIGATWLTDHAAGEAKSDGSALLTQLPFQPYEELPSMLASADVLMVLLEPDAGTFSVPSKVLTYHCAGRAILGAMPEENLASRNIVSNGSGLVVDPGDDQAFVEAARSLVDDPEGRVVMGRAARTYAEKTFDIDDITTRFAVLIRAVAAGEPPRPSTSR